MSMEIYRFVEKPELTAAPDIHVAVDVCTCVDFAFQAMDLKIGVLVAGRQNASVAGFSLGLCQQDSIGEIDSEQAD
jgi:hypothetical protein